MDGHTSDYSVSFAPTSSYTIPNGSATDNLTTPTVSVSGSVTPNVEGTYNVTYVAKDDAGNSKSLVLTVNVVITTYTFDYTGDVQSFTVPVSGIYKLEVWGAQGGISGGNGGYSKGYKTLTQGTVIYIVCGGAGGSETSGGYNGGGYGDSDNWGGRNAGMGGGATHMALVSGTLSSIGKSSFDSNGLIVAGGGGGGIMRSYGTGNDTFAGGVGGGTTGGNGVDPWGSGYYGTGGSQTSGGSYSGAFGQGGSYRSGGDCRGGGGGGYYGGGYGRDDYRTGGGGSGWIGGVTSYAGNSAFMENGTNSGNGHATITFMASE